MWKEFKEFAIKGNVMDLAIGVIIGAAFTAIVTSLVNDLINPILGLLTGGLDFSNRFLTLREGATPGPYATLDAAKAAGAVTLNVGLFLNALIGFLIIAFVIFLIVKGINRLRRQPQEVAPAPTKEEELLMEIRDLLAARPGLLGAAQPQDR